MALEEEEEDDDDEDETAPEKQVERLPTEVSIKKMGKVSSKLRQRLYNRALKNIQYAQKRSHETVEKLQFTVNLVRTVVYNIKHCFAIHESDKFANFNQIILKMKNVRRVVKYGL